MVENDVPEQPGVPAPLLEAAVATLATYGVRKSSLTDIAGKAGVSRATVYRAFGSREGMLHAVWAAEAVAFFAALSARVDPRLSPEDQLADHLEFTLDRVRTHPVAGRAIAEELEIVVPALVGSSGEGSLLADATRGMAEVLRQGEVDTQLLVPAEQVAELLVRLVVSLLLAPASGFADTRSLATALARGLVREAD